MCDFNMVLSIKARLEEGKNQSETRRFIISSDDKTLHFDQFCKRLEQIFPTLAGNVYMLYWKDEENDDILISSDEELAVAISQAQNHLLKVYIKVTSKKEERNQKVDGAKPPPVIETSGSKVPYIPRPLHTGIKATEAPKPDPKSVRENVQANPKPPAQEKGQQSPPRFDQPPPQVKGQQSPPRFDQPPKRVRTTHPGVVCDSCNEPVIGYRYKCMECENFDLCETCHAKDAHPNHNMWKFANPPDYAFWTFLTVNDTIRRLFGRVTGSYNPSRHPRRHRRGHGCGGWSASGRPSTSPTSNPTCGSSFTARGPTNGNDGAASTKTSPDPQSQANDEFLRTVGETVAAMLDPLGISVDVDVEHNNGKRERVGANAGTEGPDQQSSGSSQDGTPYTYPPEYQAWSETVRKWYEQNSTIPNAEKPTAPATEATSGMETSPEKRDVPTSAITTPPTSNTQCTSVQVDDTLIADGSSRKSSPSAMTSATSTHVQTENHSKTVPCQTVPKLLVDSATSSESKLLVDVGTSSESPMGTGYYEGASREPLEGDWYLVNELRKWGMDSGDDQPVVTAPPMPSSGPLTPEEHFQNQEAGIAEIVQQMKSMGFQDQNGWLTRMVRENGGDISVVLDKILCSIPPSIK